MRKLIIALAVISTSSFADEKKPFYVSVSHLVDGKVVYDLNSILSRDDVVVDIPGGSWKCSIGYGPNTPYTKVNIFCMIGDIVVTTICPSQGQCILALKGPLGKTTIQEEPL